MAKIKKQLRDEEEEDYYFPPNAYWQYSDNPLLTKKMWRDLDPNLKTGLRNMKILNFDCLGRYGMWPDYEIMPKEVKEQYGITKYGTSYTNTWKMWKQYVGFTNMPYYSWAPAKELMDPSERNKIYGLFNWMFEFWNYDTHEWDFWRGIIMPTGSPYSDPWGVVPPFIRKSWDRDWDGRFIDWIDWEHDRYVRSYCTVSKNSRTIKSKRV